MTVHSFYRKWDPEKAPLPFLRKDWKNVRIASQIDLQRWSKISNGLARFQPLDHKFNPPAATIDLIRKFVNRDLFLSKEEAVAPIDVYDETTGQIARTVKRFHMSPQPPRDGQYEYQEQKLQNYLNNRYVDNNCCCKHFAPPAPNVGCWGNYDEDTKGWCRWSWKTLFGPGCVLLVIAIVMVIQSETPFYRVILDLDAQVADLFDVHVGNASGFDSGIYAVSVYATAAGLGELNKLTSRSIGDDYFEPYQGTEEGVTMSEAGRGIFQILEGEVNQDQGLRLSVLFGTESVFERINANLPSGGQVGAIKVGYKIVPMSGQGRSSPFVQSYPATVLPMAGMSVQRPLWQYDTKYGPYWNGNEGQKDDPLLPVSPYRPFTPSCRRTDTIASRTGGFPPQSEPSYNMVCDLDDYAHGCNTTDPADLHSCIAYRNFPDGLLRWGPGQGCVYGENVCHGHSSPHGMAPDITKDLYGSINGYTLPSKNFPSGLETVSLSLVFLLVCVSFGCAVPFRFFKCIDPPFAPRPAPLLHTKKCMHGYSAQAPGKYMLQFTDIVIGVWVDKPSSMLTPIEKLELKNAVLADSDPAFVFGLALDKPTHWAYVALGAALGMILTPFALACMLCCKDGTCCSESYGGSGSGGGGDDCCFGQSGKPCDGCDCGNCGYHGGSCGSGGGSGECCCDGIECCCEGMDVCCKSACEGLGSCCESGGRAVEGFGSCCELLGGCAECCSGCAECGAGCLNCGACVCAC